ncbi:hypothetical protein DVH24_010682 [Malus domestica]|uniref:F-box protein At3g26010-like beta-propeller domain-containing protein n=1 Tax=Malus domestica TaxID=3750 RepID=A0A498JTU1_MALDO|nr:hypothetical protein DVH24_010682 [Malus domestica]
MVQESVSAAMKGDHTATKGIRCNTLCQSVGAHSDSDHLSHHLKGSKLPPRVPSHALSSDKVPALYWLKSFVDFLGNLLVDQCVAVPQNPTHADVWHRRGGFICEPYYKFSSEDGTGPIKKVEVIWSKCKVVLTSKITGPSEFKVEIYSSETGTWTESLVSCPQRVSYTHMTKQGVSYNGMLYCLASGGFLIGLDMFNIDMTASATSRSVNVIDQKHCRFVELGDYYDNDFERTKCLGVCHWRLRMCSLLAHNESGKVLAVWELKEEEDNGKWCSVHKILFYQRDLAISLNSLQWRNRITPVAVHPNNEDVLCIDLNRNLVISAQAFQVFLPWLPTSIPKLEDHTLTRKKRKLKKKNKVESSTPSGILVTGRRYYLQQRGELSLKMG